MATALDAVLGAAKRLPGKAANLTGTLHDKVPSRIKEASYEEVSRWFFYGVLGLFALIVLRALILARRAKGQDDSDDDEEEEPEDEKGKARSRLTTALTYLQKGRLNEAQALFDAVGVMAVEQKDPGLQHEVMAGLAKVYEAQGDAARALEFQLRANMIAFEVAKKVPADRHACFHLAQAYLQKGEIGKAGPLFDHCFALATEVNDRELVAHAGRLLSTVLQAIGDLPRAVGVLEKALKAEMLEPNLECQERSRLARMFVNMRRHADAIRELEGVARLCRESGDAVGEVLTMTRMGTVIRDTGDVPKSIELFSKCLSDADKLDPKHIQVRWEVRMSAAMAYRRVGEHPKAALLLEQAVPMAVSTGPGEEQLTRNELGMVLREMNVLDKALEQFQLAANTKQGDRYHAVHFNLGAINVAMGRIPKAAEEFEKCAMLSRKVNDMDLERKVLEELVGCYTVMNHQQKLQETKKRLGQLLSPEQALARAQEMAQAQAQAAAAAGEPAAPEAAAGDKDGAAATTTSSSNSSSQGKGGKGGKAKQK